MLPPPIRGVVERARRDDILLFASGLAFYAVVSVVPLTVLVMWIVSLMVGDQRLHQLADQIGRIAPKKLGADQALKRVATLGSRIGVVAIVTALRPATSHGSGLERAFVRLGPGPKQELPGLRGRALFFLVLIPVFILGTLVGAYASSRALGSSGLGKFLGYALALASAFGGAAAALVLIYRIFPPKRLPWPAILRGTLSIAATISVLSLGFVLFVTLGTNFDEHYASSGLAGLVVLAVWLFLSNVLLLVGYKVALERAGRDGSAKD